LRESRDSLVKWRIEVKRLLVWSAFFVAHEIKAL
jgi:hypothetical protein